MNKTEFTFTLTLSVLLLFYCSEPNSTTELDYTQGLPENDLRVLKDILETNGLENSVSNRNQIASKTELHTDDTVIIYLQRLRLHEGISFLPPSVSKLKDLESIEITKTDNKLPLPEGLNYFKPLRDISIYGRTIDTSFNEIVYQHKPRHLVINDCRIEDFPTHIFNDTSLYFLSLRNDSLDFIKPEIGQLINLESLFLDKNQLQVLPESISNLIKLKCMDISCNRFSDFPAVVTRLDSLAELNIALNTISELPDEITKLTNLIPGAIHFDGEVSITRTDYNFKISSNRICSVSAEIDSFLNMFSGDYWKETQVCKE